MSSLPNKINEEVAKALPWENMLLRHPHAKTYPALEQFLNLSHDSLRKASKGVRGLSSKTYHILMQDLIRYFSTGIEFRQWLYSSRWPQELIDRDRDYYAELYARINQAIKLPSAGLPPRHYVSRPAEETQIYEVLTGEFSTARGVYISGSGGIGKTTLIAGMLFHNLPELHRRYERIVWVDLSAGEGFEACVHQMVSGLGMEPKSQRIGGIVDELQKYFGKHPAILVCNTVHLVPELQKLVQLVGYQGRIVITSRTRLTLVQEKNYRLMHLELTTMDNTQGEQLLETMMERSFTQDEKQDVERILQITGCLPLALVLVASLAISPHISMARLANQLESHPLNALAIAGPQPSPETSVRVSLEITYAYLREHHPQAAAAFVAFGIFTRPQSTIQILRHALLPDDTTPEQDRIISLLSFHHLIRQTELDGALVWRMHPLLHELAKEFLHKDASLIGKLQPHFVNATIENLAQLRDGFQHNQPVGRIFDFLKADLMEISVGLLRDGQIVAPLNMLENASSLLVDTGHFAEYQSWMDCLAAQLQSIDISAEPIRQVVSNFMNLHYGAIQSSLNQWDNARQCWHAVKSCDVDDPAYRIIMSSQIVKARSLELIVLSRLGMVEAARIALENAQQEFKNLGPDFEQQPEWQEALIELFIVSEDFSSALHAGRRALALFQESGNLAKTIQVRKTMAEILAMTQNYAAAETVFRELMRENISSLSLMVELQIDLAYVLLQMHRPTDALAHLNLAKDLLDSFPEGTAPESFARLWSYRAWGSEQLSQPNEALDQAYKSLHYWWQLPGSEASQQTMLDMIARIQDASKNSE